MIHPRTNSHLFPAFATVLPTRLSWDLCIMVRYGNRAFVFRLFSTRLFFRNTLFLRLVFQSLIYVQTSFLIGAWQTSDHCVPLPIQHGKGLYDEPAEVITNSGLIDNPRPPSPFNCPTLLGPAIFSTRQLSMDTSELSINEERFGSQLETS